MINTNPFIYQSVFGGSNLYPSDVSYLAITIDSNTSLQWPLESAAGINIYAAKLMDVKASAIGLAIQLPDATGAGVGETILFNNVGPNVFTVTDYQGNQIASVAGAKLVQVYLADNSSQAGVWRAINYGVGSSDVQAAQLAGYGLTPDGVTLDTAIVVYPVSFNITLNLGNRAQLINWVGIAGTITLPDAGLARGNWYCIIRNTGQTGSQGQLLVSPTGTTSLIDGASSKTLNPSESCYFITDGTNWFTVGFGQNALFVFDYDAIPLVVPPATSFSGTYVLSGTDLNRIAYGFTGLLSGNATIRVPLSKQQYWIYNGTSGPFRFFVGTAGQSSPVEVPQGSRLILYCDGSNVFAANNNNLPNPIPVINGGTGSTTPSGALQNFGITSLGLQLFQATSQAQAQAALGISDQTDLSIAYVIALSS